MPEHVLNDHGCRASAVNQASSQSRSASSVRRSQVTGRSLLGDNKEGVRVSVSPLGLASLEEAQSNRNSSRQRNLHKYDLPCQINPARRQPNQVATSARPKSILKSASSHKGQAEVVWKSGPSSARSQSATHERRPVAVKPKVRVEL